MQNKIVLALMQLKGIGRKTIINKFAIAPGKTCDEKNILQILKTTKRIGEYDSSEITKAIESADKILEDCDNLNIKVMTFLDDDYPLLLKNSTDYPAVLFYKGDLSYLDSMDAVAIIGTREPSDYGKRIGYKLGESFAKKGFVDVSGLAIGCDTAGHEGCLAGDGKTIAVLAGGLDSIYPAINKDLADEIVKKGGSLVSEYPPYSEPYRAAFVERDRIQAALSNGVFVIETRERGGTFHAVRHAGEYNRPVGCFKHPFKYSGLNEASGNKMLINNGTAFPVANDDDLEAFIKLLRDTKNDIKKNSLTCSQLSFTDIS